MLNAEIPPLGKYLIGLSELIFNNQIGEKGIAFSVWEMIFSGKWHTWWGGEEKVLEWNFLWPLSFISALYYIYKIICKRRLYKSKLLGFWIFIYLLFLSFVPVCPRYLLTILPFMYVITVWIITKNLCCLLKNFNL